MANKKKNNNNSKQVEAKVIPADSIDNIEANVQEEIKEESKKIKQTNKPRERKVKITAVFKSSVAVVDDEGRSFEVKGVTGKVGDIISI